MRAGRRVPRLRNMSGARLAWPQGRRLFRAGRRLSRGLPTAVALVAAAALAAIGWSGIA